MKLYSIWWEEEIPLMCSCNDCSKKKKKEKKEEGKEKCLPAFESLERNQRFKSVFFCILQLPHPRTLLRLLWTDSHTDRDSSVDPGNIKLFWHQEASGVTASWFMENVCRFAKGRLRSRRTKPDVWRKHLHLVKHEEDALGGTRLLFSVQHIS